MTPFPAHEARYGHWLEVYRSLISKVARSFSRSTSDAVELVREIELQLWNSVPRFEGKAKESTWVYRVCLNTALTWRRDANRRTAPIDPAADLGGLPGHSPSPADRAGQDEVIAQLYRAIQAIPEFERAIVLLMLDGLSYREIADVSGLTESHVGVTLTRARRRLATLMKGVIDELD